MLYLNIIWHHHQPLYLDPTADRLIAPWVRTHATKDYYDMVAMLEEYPDVHLTVNLTSSLLAQLQEYYVGRLGSVIDRARGSIDVDRFLANGKGRIDPWIDLALTPTRDFTEQDLTALAGNTWNAFGTTAVMMNRFPQYLALHRKFSQGGVNALSEQEMREIKFWFFLAHFDPDFLTGRQKLITGYTVGVSDYLQRRSDGTFWLTKEIEEADCVRIVCEAFKVIEAVVPMHRHLMYDPAERSGQIELITTPYYHPILPLICNTDVAKQSQPNDLLPERFSYPEDAAAHVRKSVHLFEDLFGRTPAGMWPAEGAVSKDAIDHFATAGIRWIATDERILHRSRAQATDKLLPYRVSGRGGELAIFFRDTVLSDKIGFVYQHWDGKDAGKDFVELVLRQRPTSNDMDRVLTVILDGENAWEWFRYDQDGKSFLHELYARLTEAQKRGEVQTVTPSEYIAGNPDRGIKSHPIESMVEITSLWPGSWINENFDTWIGHPEKNRAWEYLRTARDDLAASTLVPPSLNEKSPRKHSRRWYAHRAWEALLAAEGSDWFWWYGTDHFNDMDAHPFETAFLAYLKSIYTLAEKAGASLPDRVFPPITKKHQTQTTRKQGGTMAQSEKDQVRVLFQCDARGFSVPTTIYIAGNHSSLGDWVPNNVPMYDDGTHGDQVAGDGIWSLEGMFPVGTVLEYKFTNSGQQGEWDPGEEFPYLTRGIVVERMPDPGIMLLDRFGAL
ncbi:MAG: hypothetical protein FJ215_03815 [Ignavibacteria bacterium]|nr:hypothetical protein [Ignavibacteria bacterium]